MLGLVTIFLITFSVAYITVRFYRAIDGWQGSVQPSTGQRNKPSKRSLVTQLGSMLSEPNQKAKTVRLRGSNSAVKAPWGW